MIRPSGEAPVSPDPVRESTICFCLGLDTCAVCNPVKGEALPATPETCEWVYRYAAPDGDRAHKTGCGWITVALLTGSYCCYCGKPRTEVSDVAAD